MFGFTLRPLRIGNLPLHDQDDDAAPAETELRPEAGIASAQGLLFVTAEDKRSIPGVLKNAPDHASRLYGHNARAGKPAGVVSASVGAAGTAVAQQHLRTILACQDVPALGQPAASVRVKDGPFLGDGQIAPVSRAFFQSWLDRYAAGVQLYLR